MKWVGVDDNRRKPVEGEAKEEKGQPMREGVHDYKLLDSSILVTLLNATGYHQ